MTGPRMGLVLLLALLAGGCGSSEEPSSGPTNSTPTTAAREPLPPAVAKKRDAIDDAAGDFDYDRLETLLDRESFSYSFGASGDPVGYWRRLEEEGHVPIMGDYLPLVLSAPYAKKGDTFVWPSAYAKSPSSWTAGDRQWLKNFYSEQEIRNFELADAYQGWRAGIREDGTWLFFVSGD